MIRQPFIFTGFCRLLFNVCFVIVFIYTSSYCNIIDQKSLEDIILTDSTKSPSSFANIVFSKSGRYFCVIDDKNEAYIYDRIGNLVDNLSFNYSLIDTVINNIHPTIYNHILKEKSLEILNRSLTHLPDSIKQKVISSYKPTNNPIFIPTTGITIQGKKVNFYKKDDAKKYLAQTYSNAYFESDTIIYFPITFTALAIDSVNGIENSTPKIFAQKLTYIDKYNFQNHKHHFIKLEYGEHSLPMESSGCFIPLDTSFTSWLLNTDQDVGRSESEFEELYFSNEINTLSNYNTTSGKIDRMVGVLPNFCKHNLYLTRISKYFANATTDNQRIYIIYPYWDSIQVIANSKVNTFPLVNYKSNDIYIQQNYLRKRDSVKANNTEKEQFTNLHIFYNHRTKQIVVQRSVNNTLSVNNVNKQVFQIYSTSGKFIREFDTANKTDSAFRFEYITYNPYINKICYVSLTENEKWKLTFKEL